MARSYKTPRPCRSVPWARCFSARRLKSIAGMARSYKGVERPLRDRETYSFNRLPKSPSASAAR